MLFFSFCHWITSYQRLFGFFVHCVLFAESAVLLCLHSLRMVLFLFCHVVITLFAFSTCQCDFYAHDFHHHCVFALSLVILADQRRSLRFCPAFAARTSAISGIKKDLLPCRWFFVAQELPVVNKFHQSTLRFFIRIVSFTGVRRTVTSAALMESFCSRRFRTGNGSAHSFSCAQNHSVYSRSLCLKKPYASDLEYAFFIWLLSSKSTLCSVAPVSFFSISAILLFASSRNCVCFVSSVSPASSASY